MLWQPEPEGHVYHFTLPEGHKNEHVMWLHWVVRLRWVAIIAQLITLSFTYKVLDGPGVVVAMAAVSVGLAALNGYIGNVLAREDDLDSGYVLGQLTVDVLALTALFALAGGTSNPFTMLYLVHVAMGTIMLTAAHAVWLGLIIVAAYSVLFVVNWPLHLDQHGLPAALLMPAGQWLGFAVTVFSVGVFVLGTSNSLRRHRARARVDDPEATTDPGDRAPAH